MQLLAVPASAARDDGRRVPTGAVLLKSILGNANNDGVYSNKSFTFTAGCDEANVIL